MEAAEKATAHEKFLPRLQYAAGNVGKWWVETCGSYLIKAMEVLRNMFGPDIADAWHHQHISHTSVEWSVSVW